MKNFVRLATAVLGAAIASSASAQAFPTKPVTVVVPFTAGGPTDLVARGIAQGMTKALGQPVVVENTAGAAARSRLGSNGSGRESTRCVVRGPPPLRTPGLAATSPRRPATSRPSAPTRSGSRRPPGWPAR